MISIESIMQLLPQESEKQLNLIENHKIYLEFHPILEDLCNNLFSNQKSIMIPFHTPPSCYLFQIQRHLDYLIPLITEEFSKSFLILDRLTLKFCELYLFGLKTNFDFCSKCSNFSIIYHSFTICKCDLLFAEDLKLFKLWHEFKIISLKKIEIQQKLDQQKAEEIKIKEEKEKQRLEEILNREKRLKKYLDRHPTFKIWDKVESMLKSYLKTQNAQLFELRVFYDANVQKMMWERLDDFKEFIISKSEMGNRSLKKSLKHDGQQSCYFTLADAIEINSDYIQLKSENSALVLYELTIAQ